MPGGTVSVRAVAFSPDGKMVGSGDHGGMIQLWDVTTRQLVGKPLDLTAGSVRTVAFSPDGRVIAAGTWDGAVQLWDVATQKPVWRARTGPGRQSVYGLAFSPDGRTLASASPVGAELQLWDVATGNLRSRPHVTPWFQSWGVRMSIAIGLAALTWWIPALLVIPSAFAMFVSTFYFPPLFLASTGLLAATRLSHGWLRKRSSVILGVAFVPSLIAVLLFAV